MNDVKRERVLVVDDEPIICSAIVRALQSRFDVDATTSGAEALTLLSEREYALILCDLMLPGVSGMELLELVRRERPDQLRRLVLMTGRAFTAAELERFASLGVQVLLKPFNSTELLMLVLGYVARARA